MPLLVGRSSPRAAPSRSPHTGAVEDQTSAGGAGEAHAEGEAGLGRCHAEAPEGRHGQHVLPGEPATWFEEAQDEEEEETAHREPERHEQQRGTEAAAYLVAAKLSPQKTAAEIREASVSTAAFSLSRVTTSDSTARTRWSAGV
jgi:hypothetical protein